MREYIARLQNLSGGGIGGKPEVAQYARQTSASGLAGVWARENTREAIFDAMERKETYATTGSRMMVRFFGGWGYSKKLVGDKDFVKKAYAGGVPMGGDLQPAAGAGLPNELRVALHRFSEHRVLGEIDLTGVRLRHEVRAPHCKQAQIVEIGGPGFLPGT